MDLPRDLLCPPVHTSYASGAQARELCRSISVVQSSQAQARLMVDDSHLLRTDKEQRREARGRERRRLAGNAAPARHGLGQAFLFQIQTETDVRSVLAYFCRWLVLTWPLMASILKLKLRELKSDLECNITVI